jgi:hypothetical protein
VLQAQPGENIEVDDIDEEEGEQMFVWGTNISIASVTKRVRDFYTVFRGDRQLQTEEAKYVALIRQVFSCARNVALL